MCFCNLRQFFYFCHPEMNSLDLPTKDLAASRAVRNHIHELSPSEQTLPLNWERCQPKADGDGASAA